MNNKPSTYFKVTKSSLKLVSTKQNNHMENYRLINEHDGNNTIDFLIAEGEDPGSKALEILGWSLVVATDVEDENE